MKQGTKKILASCMALSFLATSLPVSAAPVIKLFKPARDWAVADGVQYFGFNFNVLTPGSNEIKLNQVTIATPNDAIEYGGLVKYNATKYLTEGMNGVATDMILDVGGVTQKFTTYTYRPIKLNSMKFTLSGAEPISATAGQTLVVRQGVLADQTISPECTFDSAFTPTDVFFAIGKRTYPMTATSVTSLPAGKGKIVCRGVNYGTADKKRPFASDGKLFVNINVLAKPQILNLTIANRGAVTKAGGKCLIAAKARNTNDVEIKWTGKNLTKLELIVDNKRYAIPSPKRDNAVVYFQPDCLTPNAYPFAIAGENTKDYPVSAVPTPDVPVATQVNIF